MAATSQKRSGTTDLTVGKPLFQILRFALPLVLGTLFQQLYSFADTVIVGRCLGTDALGAVGTTYSLNFLILGFVQGTASGWPTSAFPWGLNTPSLPSAQSSCRTPSTCWAAPLWQPRPQAKRAVRCSPCPWRA